VVSCETDRGDIRKVGQQNLINCILDVKVQNLTSPAAVGPARLDGSGRVEKLDKPKE
jgi:hypothetical protein